jgi:hypothetical protein
MLVIAIELPNIAMKNLYEIPEFKDSYQSSHFIKKGIHNTSIGATDAAIADYHIKQNQKNPKTDQHRTKMPNIPAEKNSPPKEKYAEKQLLILQTESKDPVNLYPYEQREQLQEPTQYLNSAPSQVWSEVTDKFMKDIYKTFVKLIKVSLTLTIRVQLVQLSFADIIATSIQQLVFQLSNLSDNPATKDDNSIKKLKMQIQYLAQQIRNYNNKTIYTQPEQMLLLIKFINRFLEENNCINFSQEMSLKIVEVEQIATECCNFFKNQNMIFSSKNAPTKTLSYFQQAIQNTNNLSIKQPSHALMHAIYDTHGYMDTIMETWQKFQNNELAKDMVNKEYAAFLTFLLIFENSIVAAAIILDETSQLYKVTNPIPVYINIA